MTQRVCHYVLRVALHDEPGGLYATRTAVRDAETNKLCERIFLKLDSTDKALFRADNAIALLNDLRETFHHKKYRIEILQTTKGATQ